MKRNVGAMLIQDIGKDVIKRLLHLFFLLVVTSSAVAVLLVGSGSGRADSAVPARDLTPANDQRQSDQPSAVENEVLSPMNGGPRYAQYITVTGQLTDNPLPEIEGPVSQVQDYAPAADITGSQPWIWILCKFADDAAEPANLSYFQNLHAELDVYFREVSYDKANIANSNAVGWYVLPQPRTYYVYDRDSDGYDDLDYDRAAQDCTSVADLDVDFGTYYGINVMLNGEMHAPYGVTTWRQLTLDGTTEYWPCVFLDNKGSYNMALTAHEMYHGFGLGHSAVRNADGSVYSGSSWDPVGIGACGFNNCTPSHLPAPQKDELGWISASRMLTATTGSQTITLEALAFPQAGGYLMAKIPIGDDHFYTLEARRQAGYDQKIPGSTVLIHEVNLNPGAFWNGHIGLIPVPGKDEPWGIGAMWTAGDTFSDTASRITVSVITTTDTGFEVRITVPEVYTVYLPTLLRARALVASVYHPSSRLILYRANAIEGLEKGAAK